MSSDGRESGRLTKNALFSALQVIVGGAVLFLLYRLLLRTLSADAIGTWSLVLACASLSKLAELGLSGSAVKFIAGHLANAESVAATEAVQTTALTISIALGVVLISAYPAINWLIVKFVPRTAISVAVDLLPYALCAAWLSSVGAALVAGLEGCQRFDLKAVVLILANLLMLLLADVLTAAFGIMGLALAHVGQGASVVVLAWVLLGRELPGFGFHLPRWRKKKFKEMLSYGLNFQLNTLLVMIVDPTTKFLLGHFGNLSQVAFFEMSNRFVSQFRAVLVTMNQVIVPHVANLKERQPSDIQPTYRLSYRAAFFAASPLFAIVAASIPFVCDFWIGTREPFFIFSSVLLTAALWVNAVSAPAFFVNLGTGAMKWNSISFATMVTVNCVLGVLLGHYFGANGVVVAFASALTASAGITICSYHKLHGIPWTEIVPRESFPLVIACFALTAIGWTAPRVLLPIDSVAYSSMLTFALTSSGIAPFMYFHPLSRKIWAPVSSLLTRHKR
jgi:O-antigen/teichoic acid export membrane protein